MSASPRIVVIGSGVLGLCTAVELTLRGHVVTVIDSGGPNASRVAAGMIAPGLEAALDNATPTFAGLLRDAAALWPAFADDVGIRLGAGPSEWRGRDAAAVADRLARLGFACERDGDVVRVIGDRWLDPEPAMSRFVLALERPIINGTVRGVRCGSGGWVVETDDASLIAEVVVIATGVAAPPPGLPEATADLIRTVTPIRGQIGMTTDLHIDRTVRGDGAYVTPRGDGVAIGATMEAGRRDLTPDVEAGEALLNAAWPILGTPQHGLDIDWRVGIRGATPDGLPMAGWSGEPGLHLALAPRRNGWLLGPLVAQVVADGIEGRAPGGHAAALDPRRFISPQGR